MNLRTNRYVALSLLLALCVASAQTSCSPDDVSKVKKKVADAAAILNAVAKSNRSLYQSGVYGPVGSAQAILKRQRVATAVYQANEWLSMAVERAATLTADTLPDGKTDIVALLRKAADALATVHVDNENIQLAITTAITAINTAVTLTMAIKGN